MKFCIWCVAAALAFVVGLTIGFFFLAPEVQIAVVGALERAAVALMNNAIQVGTGVAAVSGVVMTWLNGRKLNNVADVALPMAHTAGKREGFVGGIEVGRQQVTAPAPLGK